MKLWALRQSRNSALRLEKKKKKGPITFKTITMRKLNKGCVKENSFCLFTVCQRLNTRSWNPVNSDLTALIGMFLPSGRELPKSLDITLILLPFHQRLIVEGGLWISVTGSNDIVGRFHEYSIVIAVSASFRFSRPNLKRVCPGHRRPRGNVSNQEFISPSWKCLFFCFCRRDGLFFSTHCPRLRLRAGRVVKYNPVFKFRDATDKRVGWPLSHPNVDGFRLVPYYFGWRENEGNAGTRVRLHQKKIVS